MSRLQIANLEASALTELTAQQLNEIVGGIGSIVQSAGPNGSFTSIDGVVIPSSVNNPNFIFTSPDGNLTLSQIFRR
jgi:hypothetical protein